MQAFPRMALLSALAVAGCSGSSSDEDGDRKPVVGVLHAVSDMGNLTFLRVEEVWADLDYGEGTSFRSIDADHYNFNFDARLPGNGDTPPGDVDPMPPNDDDTTPPDDDTTPPEGDTTPPEDDSTPPDDETGRPDNIGGACLGDLHGEGLNDCTRIATVPLEVRNDHEYTVILTGQFGSLDVLVDEQPFHEFDDDDLRMQLQVFHLSTRLDDVDVYLERPGTHLSPVQVRATLSGMESSHNLINEGDYVLTLSAVGDPATPYFVSESFRLDRRTRIALAIRDSAGEDTSEFVVSMFRDRSATLRDRNRETELRVAHVATSIGPIDLYARADFSQPLVAELSPGGLSSYQTLTTADLAGIDLDATPAGNPGVFLTRERINIGRGERGTFFLLGTQQRLGGVMLSDGFRRLATHASLRMLNGAHAALDVYVVPQGSNIAHLAPTASLTFSSDAGTNRLAPGRYDVVMRPRGSNDIAFGPITVDLAAAGLYTMVATDTGEMTSAGLLLLDDFLD